jgi:hypothetical protein
MTKHPIVTCSIPISKAGAIQHFEMRLPSNTILIEGVEYSIRFGQQVIHTLKIATEGRLPKYNSIADIRLNGGKDSHWYYATTCKDWLVELKPSNFYFQNSQAAMPYMFGKKSEGDTLNIIPNTSRLKGFVKDILGSTYNTDLDYMITLCLHLQTK